MSANLPAQPPVIERWLRVHPDVTGITNLSRTTIYGYLDRGLLKSKKIGGSRRISESALAEFMARFDGNGEVTQ